MVEFPRASNSNQARVRSARDLSQRLEARLLEAEDEEAALRAIRTFQAEEILRIGLHDVAGSLEALEVCEQLTDLAEVCLAAGIAAALPALRARMGGPRTGVTVLGLGSFGAREMRYGSDLDLVFLYGADGESETTERHDIDRARLAALHRHHGGDAGGGAAL